MMNNQNEYFELYKEKLYKLVLYCKNNIKYYNSNWDFEVPSIEEFDYNFFANNIPILEKTVVRNDSRAFLDESIKEDKLSVDSTSGTEGKPIICYRSKKERFECSNSIWKMRRRFVKDLRPSDKFARFYAFRNKNHEVIADEVLYKDNDILLPLFNLSDEKLIQYWEKIVEFKPRWLHGPSSTIYNMALVVQKYNLQKYAFEFIELSGEYVQKNHQKVIQEVFMCKTADQYGCREYWPMAYSNIDGRLQVITDNIFIEQFYSEQHNSNELIITLLKNNAWPLVRYRLEDLGDYVFDNSNIYLTMKRGRKADFFIMANERRFNAIVFSALARAICEIYGFNVILQFQIIKKTNYELQIYLKINPDAPSIEVMERYKQEMIKIVGKDINITIVETDYIFPDKVTGKTREFIELA